MKTMTFRRFGVIMLLLLTGATHFLPAQTYNPVNWKDRYITLNQEFKSNHSLAYPANSQYTVVVWQDERDNNSDIYAQLFDNATGIALWEPINGVPVCTLAGEQVSPKAAYDSAGGVIIVWCDLNGGVDSTAGYLYAQRLSISSGAKTWTSYPNGAPVCTATGNYAGSPRIVGTKDGAYIAWTDYRSANYGGGFWSNMSVYLQYILSSTGSYPTGGLNTWVTDGIQVPDNNSDWDMNPELCLDYKYFNNSGKNGCVVVYQSMRQNEPTLYIKNVDIYGSTLFGDNLVTPSAPVDPDHQMTNHSVASTGSHIAGVPNYGTLISWQIGTDGIYAQCIATNGSPSWNSSGVLAGAIGGSIHPIIKSKNVSGQNAYGVIVWEDFSYGEYHVYINRVTTSNGAMLFANGDPVAKTPQADQGNHDFDIVNNTAYVVWQDDRSGVFDIYYQSYTIDTWSALMPTYGWPVTKANGDQIEPKAAGNVFLWWDARQGVDLYAQTIGDACDDPSDMHYKDVFVKWTQSSAAENYRYVVDDNGYSYAVWQETRNGSPSPQIYAQKLTPSGVPMWFNDGVLIADDGQNPDICIALYGGAHVVYHDMNNDLHGAGILSSGALQALSPYPMNTTGTNPKIVEDDAGGYYAVYHSSWQGIPQIHFKHNNYLGQELLPFINNPVNPLDASSDVKICKDYQGGVFAFSDQGLAYFWNPAVTPPFGAPYYLDYSSMPWQGAGLSLISTEGFDIISDPVQNPSLLFNDAMVTFTGVMNNMRDIYAFRIWFDNAGNTLRFSGDNSPTPFNVSDNLGAGRTLASSRTPSIDADSLSAVSSDQVGGSLIIWENMGSDGSASQLPKSVLMQRVLWQWDPVGDYTGTMFWPNQTPPREPLLGTFIGYTAGVFDTRPDIAKLNVNVPGYCLTGWVDDRNNCNGIPYSVRLQYVDYTNPNAVTCQFWQPSVGVEASPGTPGDYPVIKHGGDVMGCVYWLDSRTASACIAATQVYNNLYTGLRTWGKESDDKQVAGVPQDIVLGQNYPNPYSLASGETAITLEMKSAADVTVTLYDVMGRKIGSIYSGTLDAGTHQLYLRRGALSSPLAPGIYFYRLTSGSVELARKMTVVM